MAKFLDTQGLTYFFNKLTGKFNKKISIQDHAPSNPVENDLWIDTDDDSSLIGVRGATTTSDSDTYSCNYLNQHLYDMYSENEVLTNKIWIDGRPIYRKVISGSINSSTGSIQVSDLETLVKYYGNCTIAGSNDKRPFPFYELNASGHLFDFSIFGNGYINYNSTWNSATYQIIIEYTKTTDSGDR